MNWGDGKKPKLIEGDITNRTTFPEHEQVVLAHYFNGYSSGTGFRIVGYLKRDGQGGQPGEGSWYQHSWNEKDQTTTPDLWWPLPEKRKP